MRKNLPNDVIATTILHEIFHAYFDAEIQKMGGLMAFRNATLATDHPLLKQQQTYNTLWNTATQRGESPPELAQHEYMVQPLLTEVLPPMQTLLSTLYPNLSQQNLQNVVVALSCLGVRETPSLKQNLKILRMIFKEF